MQLSMLKGWLERLEFPFGVLIGEGFMFKRDSQLYWAEVVGLLHHMLLCSFVIIEHSRTYQTKLSQVAVFDPGSSILVAVYKFDIFDWKMCT